MKFKKTFYTTIFACLFILCLTSCSTDTMRSTDSFMRNAARDTRNTIDRGMNAIDNGINGMNGSYGGMYGSNGMNGNNTNRAYSADGGYSNYSASGRDSMTGITGNTNQRGDMLPSITSKSRDNYGQINTTNGRADGGMGDIYKDSDTRRNTLGVDTFK